MKPEAIVERVLELLKREMKTRKITYDAVAAHMGTSLATVKRFLNDDDASLARIAELADWLGVDFFDLVAQARRDEAAEPVAFTPDQETLLSAESGHRAFFFHFPQRRTEPEIASALRLSESSVRLYVRDLERAGLIVVSERGVVRWKHVAWRSRPGGEMDATRLERKLENVFARIRTVAAKRNRPETRAARESVYSSFVVSLSQASLVEMAEELRSFTRRWEAQAAREERRLAPQERTTVSWLGYLDRFDAYAGIDDQIREHPSARR